MLNNCIFQGRFAADPEMRTTQSGLTVASFRMAVDRDNVGQDGRRATSSRSRWASTPRASGNSGREPPIILAMFRSARAFLRAATMISRFWTMPMICRSNRGKGVVGW